MPEDECCAQRWKGAEQKGLKEHNGCTVASYPEVQNSEGEEETVEKPAKAVRPLQMGLGVPLNPEVGRGLPRSP